MTISKLFKLFYNIDLEIGPNNKLYAHGMENHTGQRQKELATWIKENKEYILNSMKTEKRTKKGS